MPAKRGYRKKSYRKKKTAVKTVSQVKKIAKSVIYKEAESKYFQTADHSERAPDVAHSGSDMCVLGFTTGDDLDAVAGSTYQYGTQNMRALNVHRVFDRSSSGADAYLSLEGFYATPTFCQSRFLIERTITNSGSGAVPAQTLPFYCRVLRLVPRPRKSSNQSVQPNVDAFMDEQGQPTGVFNSTFNKLKLITYKVNTRKYIVKGDHKFLMNTPMNHNELAISAGTQNVVVNPNGMKTMNFIHDIGKKLFYKEPDAGSSPNYPTSGFKNEFILFHFQTVGDNTGTRNIANNVRISVNAVSSFKDI
jgi:hypothetical protein